MLDNRKCKACSASVRLQSKDVQRMIDAIKKNKSFKLASEELYISRLEKCSDCEYLEYDTTCMQCGCIVQVRALLKDKRCPISGKW